MDKDIIVGIHSIAEAIKNSERSDLQLFCTEDALSELQKKGGVNAKKEEHVEVKLYGAHKLQEEAGKVYKELDFKFSRVPGNMYLLSSSIEQGDFNWLRSNIESGKVKKIICLDQVTDAHNGAAIMRTAAFYGVDAIVLASKGNFGKSPSFARIASGALEHVKVVKVPSLPKVITKLKGLGIAVIGLSEHANISSDEISDEEKTCLVLGAEDVGMSNAVSRVVDKTIALTPQGKIKSLNVSVAAAVAMEKFYT